MGQPDPSIDVKGQSDQVNAMFVIKYMFSCLQWEKCQLLKLFRSGDRSWINFKDSAPFLYLLHSVPEVHDTQLVHWCVLSNCKKKVFVVRDWATRNARGYKFVNFCFDVAEMQFVARRGFSTDQRW